MNKTKKLEHEDIIDIRNKVCHLTATQVLEVLRQNLEYMFRRTDGSYELPFEQPMLFDQLATIIAWHYQKPDRKLSMVEEHEARMADSEKLIKAAIAILEKCNNSPIVEDVMSVTAVWDDAECDGHCLLTEMKDFING